MKKEEIQIVTEHIDSLMTRFAEVEQDLVDNNQGTVASNQQIELLRKEIKILNQIVHTLVSVLKENNILKKVGL